MIKWIVENLFVLLVNLYGGVLVVSYFFDSGKDYWFIGLYSVLLDDKVFRYLVIIYVKNYRIMSIS